NVDTAATIPGRSGQTTSSRAVVTGAGRWGSARREARIPATWLKGLVRSCRDLPSKGVKSHPGGTKLRIGFGRTGRDDGEGDGSISNACGRGRRRRRRGDGRRRTARRG